MVLDYIVVWCECVDFRIGVVVDLECLVIWLFGFGGILLGCMCEGLFLGIKGMFVWILFLMIEVCICW